MIQPQTRLQTFVRQKLARRPTESFGETIDIFLLYRQSRRHFVPSKFLQSPSATLQRFNEI